MKKVFLINWTINISVWIVTYLASSFVRWELRNPFQWIIDIPTSSPDHRALLLLSAVVWQALQILIIYVNVMVKKK